MTRFLSFILLLFLLQSCNNKHYISRFNNTGPSYTSFEDFSKEAHSIFFRFNSFKLTEDSKYRLDKIITEVNKVKNATLMLYGYTDRVGSSKINMYFAQKRIHSIKKYLIDSCLITKNNIRIKEIILGEHDPLISPQTINNNPHSRRVDIFIVP